MLQPRLQITRLSGVVPSFVHMCANNKKDQKTSKIVETLVESKTFKESLNKKKTYGRETKTNKEETENFQ